MKTRIGLLTVIVCAAVLGGCATGYQKEGITGGFSERRISDSAYFVSFSGNGFASQERVHWFWLYRCAELTLQQKHNLFVIEKDNPTSGRIDDGWRLRPAVYADNGQGRVIHTAGAVYVPIYTPGPGTIKTFTSAATVLMYDRPLPQEVVEAWDAQAVMSTLDAYVKSDAKTAAPTTDDLGQRALVAHDEISLQSIDSIGSPATDTSAADAKPLRADANIRALLNGFLVRAVLRAGYRASFGAGSDYRAPATASWNITISPNGLVSDCRLVTSTLNEAKLTENITGFLRRLNFGPLDVRATQARGVRIAFKPLD